MTRVQFVTLDQGVNPNGTCAFTLSFPDTSRA